MSLVQLVYVSRPSAYDHAIVDDILATAWSNNLRDDITGALICREDIFMQMLEGPEKAVMATYAGIRADHRHHDVTLRSLRPVSGRLFPAWAMRDDPAESWMWSQAEVDAGMVDRAPQADLLAVFTLIASFFESAGWPMALRG